MATGAGAKSKVEMVHTTLLFAPAEVNLHGLFLAWGFVFGALEYFNDNQRNRTQMIFQIVSKITFLWMIVLLAFKTIK